MRIPFEPAPEPPGSSNLEPEPFSFKGWLTHGDRSPPPLWWTMPAAVGLAGVFAALAGAWVGVAVGLAAFIAGRWTRARWLLALGSPGALAVAALYVLQVQARHHIAPGIEWPHELERAHPFGWLAVGLLVAEAVVGRVWASFSKATSPRRVPAHARRRRGGRRSAS